MQTSNGYTKTIKTKKRFSFDELERTTKGRKPRKGNRQRHQWEELED